MNANITPLPSGSGKYEHTLNWLIETAQASSKPPHVKRPKGIVYVTTRDEVERRDISRFMANFGPQISVENMLVYQNTILWTVDGYDSDPKELHEIPEVREFYVEVHRRWPAWLFFSDMRGDCLQMVARCVIPSHTQNKCRCCLDQELQSFFDHGLPPAAWFHKKLNIPPEDGVTHLRQIAHYLGLSAL